MPELPEVETIVRALAPRIVGRHILNAEFLSQLVLRHNRSNIEEALRGRLVRAVERRGKFILIHLDSGVLTIHLGMTGKLLFGAPQSRHTHAIFALDDCILVYEDPRQFGSLEWTEQVPERIEALGPEPFDISAPEFAARLARHKAPVKSLLLNQRFLRGIGNIYADEALFRAGVHPRAKSSRIRLQRASRLHAAITEVLLEAIGHRGSSVSDYVDADGNKGGFQGKHRVYGRESKACTACGTPIRKIVLGQRGTHYCPKCQRV